MAELWLILQFMADNPQMAGYVVIFVAAQVELLRRRVSSEAKTMSENMLGLEERVEAVESKVASCPARQLPQIPAS